MLDLRTLSRATLEQRPEATALIIGTRSISYREFDAAIQSHADRLALLGMGRGDRIGLMSHNSPDLAALLMATWRIGAIAVPLNHRYQGPEVEYAASTGGLRMLIVQDALADRLAGRFDPPEGLEHVRTLGRAVPAIGPAWAVGEGDDPPPVKPAPPVDEEVAAIYFTSGSTSKPKGVVHTARSIIETGRSRRQTMDLREDDVWLLSTQLVHVSASLGSLIPALTVGGTVVLLEEFSPERWLEAFRAHRPTRSVILPSLLHDVLDCPAHEKVDFGSIRSMECGGDFVTPDLYAAWGRVCEEPLSQLIGMTECEGYCLRHPGTPLREGAAGTPRVGVEVRVVDERDRPLPPDRIGELCIRSASMTTGYWNDEAHTREAIRDGWLHSGDQGRIDEDGNVWFVGRSKEIIVKRGSNIAPGEVESVLDQHPDIAESAVVGTPPGPHGQRVVAFVEAEPGRELDVPGTRDWAAERIAAFKVPDEWVLIDQLPRNPVGKLDRAELHRRCTERFPAE